MAFLIDEEIDAAARLLREKLGIDHLDLLQPSDLIRRLIGSALIDRCDIVPDEDLPDYEARFHADERCLVVRQSVADPPPYRAGRARWTIGHECGHIALGHQGIRNRSTQANIIEKIDARLRREEREAHRFAAAFLAPAYRVNFLPDATTADQLSQRFGLSAEAAANRYSELARRYRRENRIERDLPDFAIDFLTEARKRGYDVRSLETSPKAREAQGVGANAPRRDDNGAAPTDVGVAASPAADPPLTSTSTYLNEPCPICGERKLMPHGSVNKCLNCGGAGGLFADGDKVD